MMGPLNIVLDNSIAVNECNHHPNPIHAFIVQKKMNLKKTADTQAANNIHPAYR